MPKYLIRFSKKGYIRFTSHLDMMRLFQRCFKRAGIALAYSQGFHPHPRMSIAQPLSLGFTSEGEYIQLETDAWLDPKNDIQEKLNPVMPEGMDILFVKELPRQTKSLASMIEYGAYEVQLCMEAANEEKNMSSGQKNGAGEEKNGYSLEKLRNDLIDFMQQNEITIQKIQKKSGKEIIVDIKPMIYGGIIQAEAAEAETAIKNNNIYRKNIMLTFVLSTGSVANLNPELLLKEFFAFAAMRPIEGSVLICRKDLLFKKTDGLFSLSAV